MAGIKKLLQFTLSAFGDKKRIEAKIEGKIVGMIKLEGSKKMEVIDVMVDGEHEGNGIGTELFKKALNAAKDEGSKFLRGKDLLDPRQVQIRSHYKTKFLGRHFQTDQGSRLTKEQAMKYVEQRPRKVRVDATTKVPGGEGSRGGKIVGHTRSGAPVYASSIRRRKY